jgi:hypothetical protein
MGAAGASKNPAAYRCGNHIAVAECASHRGEEAFAKILARFESFKFDANSRCIRVDIAQKAHGHANPGFKPVC